MDGCMRERDISVDMPTFSHSPDVIIIDGGLSTQLASVTGEAVDGHPLWTARYLSTNPEAVFQAHLEFLNAGAEVIITNTYQASVPGFVKHLGLNEKSSYELIKEAVRIAKRAIDVYMSENPNAAKPKIAGSVGPYGACLNDGSEYTGDYVDRVSSDRIVEWHIPRITALMEEGVDLLAIETIPALLEAVWLLGFMKQHPEQKMWLSFQCKDDRHIAHGETFQDAVRTCWDINSDQLVAVGCNCVNPKFVPGLLSSVSGSVPLIVYPNSGEEYSSIAGWSGVDTGSDFIAQVGSWLDLGVKYIGGCCRTNAGHISGIRNAVRKWSRKDVE